MNYKTVSTIENIKNPEERSQLCDRVLRQLPDWFGIESAIVNYTNEVADMPTFSYRENELDIGFLSLNLHTEFAAEIHVMGILSEHHRKGIGQKLVNAAEEYLRSMNIRFFTVKTISPKRECKFYAKSRRFYEAMDFVPIEEFPSLWGENNPCWFLVKAL